jgi:hypothetical protein
MTFLTKSYTIPFAPHRELNKGKKIAVETVLWAARTLTNIVYDDMHNGVAKWK